MRQWRHVLLRQLTYLFEYLAGPTVKVSTALRRARFLAVAWFCGDGGVIAECFLSRLFCLFGLIGRDKDCAQVGRYKSSLILRVLEKLIAVGWRYLIASYLLA